MGKTWYQNSYRRMLVDMHIADWDEKFLSRCDPGKMVELYRRANLTSVMFYCQSHVGLCYWPTKTGKMHPGLKGRDIVGEMVKQLKAHKMTNCAYYSVIYNNWAFLEHPEWRIHPAGNITDGSFAGERYGHCCPNNPGYHNFAMAQVDELLGSYDFDGFFFDMTFWPAICLCSHCRALYRKETGKDIPKVIDWTSPDWCEFQTAREKWVSGFIESLSARVKGLKPKISVYHNFSTVMFNWTLGLPSSSAVHHDFLGADFYGDPIEQLVVSKLMINLTPDKPMEYMTGCCVNLRDHVRLKRHGTMKMQAFAATLFSSAFLFIDAINIDGTVNPEIYERIGQIYAETAKYEPYLGGTGVEDIAVYFSSESKMDFAENGLPVKQAPMWSRNYPHLQAVRGACRILQQAHLPFGVITRRELPKIGRYKVIVLPNILRLDKEEIEILREYVQGGGKIYASRYTSLTETKGLRHLDFMMADIFGCHFSSDNLGKITYLKPADSRIAEIISPQEYVSQFLPGSYLAKVEGSAAGMLCLDRHVEGKTLMTLTLPYASPKMGTVFDQNWASIHSSPPWNDTEHPVIVHNSFGKGQSIYSAADIESGDSEVNDNLFLRLIRSLLDETPSYTADAHPAVWMNVFHQPENSRFLVGFLNYQTQMPVIPLSNISFTLKVPAGKKFKKLLVLPEEREVDFTIDMNGTLHAETRDIVVFKMLAAEYE
jgi:hypothetical protein